MVYTHHSYSSEVSFYLKLSDFDSSPLGIFRGCHVTTVEGIGTSNKPHPVQRRVAELHGSQSLGVKKKYYNIVAEVFSPYLTMYIYI